jgi:hypothetical protein
MSIDYPFAVAKVEVKESVILVKKHCVDAHTIYLT